MDKARRQMEIQALQERRVEIDAQTRRLQLEEQLDQMAAQPMPWPGQPRLVAHPFQGVPAGWSAPRMGYAQAVQIGPELGQAAQFQVEAPQQLWLRSRPGGGLGASGGRQQESGRPGGEVVPDPQGPPGDWQPGGSAQQRLDPQVPRGGRERPPLDEANVRPRPRDPARGLRYPTPELPHMAWVPSEEHDLESERWQKCLLCNKWVNDEHSHSGTLRAPDGSVGHQKNLRNYPPGSPWYERNVVEERRRWHPAQSGVQPISV